MPKTLKIIYWFLSGLLILGALLLSSYYIFDNDSSLYDISDVGVYVILLSLLLLVPIGLVHLIKHFLDKKFSERGKTRAYKLLSFSFALMFPVVFPLLLSRELMSMEAGLFFIILFSIILHIISLIAASLSLVRVKGFWKTAGFILLFDVVHFLLVLGGVWLSSFGAHMDYGMVMILVLLCEFMFIAGFTIFASLLVLIHRLFFSDEKEDVSKGKLILGLAVFVVVILSLLVLLSMWWLDLNPF